MKICVISNLYSPIERGGAEKVAQLMAEALAQKHQVFVISTSDRKEQFIDIQTNVKVYRFRPLNLFYYLNDHKHNIVVRLIWHFLDMFNLSSALTVRKILINEKPDLVITHNLMGLGFLIPNAIFACGIKHIHVLHDVQLAVPSGLILKGKENDFSADSFLTKLYARFCRNLFIKVQAVISPSQWLLNFHSQKDFFPKAKKLIIPNPTSLNPASRQKDVRTNKYLFIGQLEKHKGIEWVLNIWRKNYIKDELFIVGDGTMELDASDINAQIIGKAQGEEVNKIFAQADFLIVPSLCYENSPTVIPLAYKNATPVIVADIGGAAELIYEGRTGFKFEAGNEQSFLLALEKAKVLPLTEYTAMSKNCLEETKEFSVEKYISEIIILSNNLKAVQYAGID